MSKRVHVKFGWMCQFIASRTALVVRRLRHRDAVGFVQRLLLLHLVVGWNNHLVVQLVAERQILKRHDGSKQRFNGEQN